MTTVEVRVDSNGHNQTIYERNEDGTYSERYALPAASGAYRGQWLVGSAGYVETTQWGQQGVRSYFTVEEDGAHFE